jgi:methylenetetrahydrofolate reductase (NADPH)
MLCQADDRPVRPCRAAPGAVQGNKVTPKRAARTAPERGHLRTISRMTTFAEALARNDGRLVLAELAPWAGTLQDQAGDRLRAEARELAADRRISAITITDNAGGHVRLGPLTLGHAIHDLGGEVLVHVACRERNRASLETLAYGLASAGLTNVLALSGDFPKEGYRGRSRPVFDIDSVALLELLRDATGHGIHFTSGCAVNPFKALEADLLPQLLKLQLKARAGAAFAICQVGWDPRALDELRRWSEARSLGLALVAPVYVLSRGVARVFHRDEIPGIRLSAELLAMVEQAAASPDKGRGRFLELAAMQVAVARGLGYAGVYIAGQRDAAELDRILAMADAFAPDQWRDMLPEVSWPEPGAHRLYESGEAPQLASDRPLAPPPAAGAPPFYRFSRLVHDHVFDPGSLGFRAARTVYGRLDGSLLDRPAHVLEQMSKIPLYGCKDCGDCSLPDIAYQCPESACSKNQRNGPCGGSINGRCEVPDKPCIWTVAYDRLKPYGEALTMLDREPVLQDHALRGSSAWANTFLGRDHYKHHRGGEQ